MSRFTKLIVLGSIVAAGASMLRRKRPAAASSVPSFDPREPPAVSGIADVDPQPLTQIAGEGIDLDATEAAHRDVVEQRERLPRPGDNVR